MVATSGEEGLRVAQEQRPELVLVDVGLPDQSGISVGKRILAELGGPVEPVEPTSSNGSAAGTHHEEPARGVRVVAVTAMEDPRLAQEALRAGFHGYLMKDSNVSQLLSSIKAVLDGQIVVPQKLARGPAGARGRYDADAYLLGEQLTRRELEVLELLAGGAGSRDISRELGVAPNTVRTHVQSILSKLQVHSRLEAAAFAVRHSLVRPRRHR